MTRYINHEDAGTYDCPVARIKGDGTKGKCQGDSCIMWRRKQILSSNQYFMSAVKREMSNLALELNDGKNPMKYHKEAVRNVDADPESFGVKEDRGYCGLGGKP
jgi:hypothetical protein